MTIIQIRKRSVSPLMVLVPKLIFFGLFLTLIGASPKTNAQDMPAKNIRDSKTREIFWSFDSNLLVFNKTLADGSDLQGQAGSFTVGYGRSRADTWLMTRFHILSGPWNAARQGSFDADYAGTMLDIEYGASFPGFRLRGGSSPVIALAGGYLDINGKNIGGNKKALNERDPDAIFYMEQDFKTILREIYLEPSLGWSWTKEARSTSNDQESLNTRVESSTVKLSAIIPIYSHSRIDVHKREKQTDPKNPPKKISTSGPTKGFAVATSVSLWLGI